ncbi:MAG: Mov34/MPN/PAD-1 family protein [Gemmataceae bacterium]
MRIEGAQDGGMDARGWWRAATDAARKLAEAMRPHLPPEPPRRRPLAPIARLQLTDEVSRTLFAEYAEHRGSERGHEETGWALLGLREGDSALALATLPAGAQRHAGEAHVRFNSSAQVLASRILRQHDKRLTLLGVVHTHPGSMRHPSQGDYRGDHRWVEQLRGQEGVFGIGTADADDDPQAGVAWHPTPNR